jgi:hypothetical protein
MPFYDYYCTANKKTVEVYHGISIRLKNWQEVCEYAKIPLGKTSPQSAVIRLVSEVNPMIFKLKGLDKDAPTKRSIV